MSGGSAQSIRRHSVELWQDFVLHGIRKSTFQHLTVNWNFNVLEMALEFYFCPGSLQDSFVICSSTSHQHISHKKLQKGNISRIKNLEIRKFKNPGSLTRAHVKVEPEVEPEVLHENSWKPIQIQKTF